MPDQSRIPRGFLAALALVTLSAVTARALTLGQPIVNIDEQFYLLAGDRMLAGALPYVDIWDRKPPFLFAIYAGIRMLGGQGVWEASLVATGFVVLTALLIRRLALRLAGPAGALAAAVAYCWWSALTGGVLGQAGVFFNAFMALAALLLVKLMEADRSTARVLPMGVAAMLLAGLTVQTKQSAVFEAGFFGLVFALIVWRRRPPAQALGMIAAAALAALLPSLSAVAIWQRAGALDALLFATVTSAGLRAPMQVADYAWHVASSLLMVLPLLAFALLGLRRAAPPQPQPGSPRAVRLFLAGWLAVSLLALLAYDRTFYDHYLLPVLVPACICAAPAFDRWRAYRLPLAATAVALAGAVFALQWHERAGTGGWRTIAALDAATRGQRNCPFSYGGPSSAYLLNGWCLPTPYAFAGHLTFAAESPAIGVDAVGEVARILERRPDRIVLRADPGPKGNLAARALVEQRVARDYDLVTRIEPDGLLVFRLKPQMTPLPNRAPRLGGATSRHDLPAPIDKPARGL